MTEVCDSRKRMKLMTYEKILTRRGCVGLYRSWKVKSLIPHSSSRRRKVTKKPMRSRVSAVKILSGSSPHKSSAAAFMAGATTSRVVFINSSASHSKTFWICCGLGFCKSWMAKKARLTSVMKASSLSSLRARG
ncbi:kinetochore protein nuf2, partial [Aureobasidium melanogenum]